jgi:hypothetical protein
VRAAAVLAVPAAHATGLDDREVSRAEVAVRNTVDPNVVLDGESDPLVNLLLA